MHALLVSGAFMARERILAVTPYFVPDATLLMALTLAARRGIAVDLVLPARSNHRLADVARNRPLRDLARAGARVWLTPHMVHAKAVVIDDELRAGRLGQPRRAQPLPQLRADGRVLRPADIAAFAAWIDARAPRRHRLSGRQTPGWSATSPKASCSGSRSSSEPATRGECANSRAGRRRVDVATRWVEPREDQPSVIARRPPQPSVRDFGRFDQRPVDRVRNRRRLRGGAERW